MIPDSLRKKRITDKATKKIYRTKKNLARSLESLKRRCRIKCGMTPQKRNPRINEILFKMEIPDQVGDDIAKISLETKDPAKTCRVLKSGIFSVASETRNEARSRTKRTASGFVTPYREANGKITYP